MDEKIDIAFLKKWDIPVPRYTSYPTAPQFQKIEEETYRKHLDTFNRTDKALSLYIHIPFCKRMCLFCGCSVVLNRSLERQKRYVKALLWEIEKIASLLPKKKRVTQLHFGGGTPTSLSSEELGEILHAIDRFFILEKEAEISIEIDPRTVYSDRGEKLEALKKLGVTRVSFGVQDLNPEVQRAVRRDQSEEMTLTTFHRAKALGFSGINIDLIYGLPHQTIETFSKTADRLVEIQPDRIAFYSYAKVPWIKKHQRAIPEETLPKVDEKMGIYLDARKRFIQGGYIPIGMDHFSLENDSLTKGYFEKKLTRNFQGYSLNLSEDMIGFGMSSIGFLEGGYFQNTKDLQEYFAHVEKGRLPIERGYLLSDRDKERKKIILDWMCRFEVEKKDLPEVDLTPLIEEGFIEEEKEKWVASALGRVFIRVIAAKFDTYLSSGRFSRAI